MNADFEANTAQEGDVADVAIVPLGDALKGNEAAQAWFLAHYQEVPQAKWYAVGPDGLIGHGGDLETVKQAVVQAGHDVEDKRLLYVCMCGSEGGCK